MNHKKSLAPPVTGLRTPQNALLIAVLLGMMLAFLPTIAYAQPEVGAPAERPEWLKPWKTPQVPEDYQSPGELHKVIVEKGDTVQPGILKRIHPWNVYQYHRRKLYLISTSQLSKLPTVQQEMLNIRDDLNLIRLRDRFFDTTVPQPAVSEKLRLVPKQQKQLHLIQFVGPVRDDWISDLRQIEGVTIVDYIPQNAYLVWVDKSTRGSLADWSDFQYYVQWNGPYHPAYKIHPGLDLGFDGEVRVTIQLVTHDKVSESISFIKAKTSVIILDTRVVGQYTNISVQLPALELINIANLQDVVNIEPRIPDGLFGERQDQIVAGDLNAAGTGPVAPGYLAWLNGLGFNSNFDFVVDITDDGFDRGQTGAANIHEDFLDAGGASRIVYVRKVDGTTISTSDDNNCSGHGTIDAAIVGGFNDTPGTDPDFDYYGDGDGYRYGLGVAPYVLLGSSARYHSGGIPNNTTLIDTAYGDGARISSNSWGAIFPSGSYDTDSQEYDRLVRDARPSTAVPSGGMPGNQEMVIIFAAGNGGAGAQTIGDFGSAAKNTITVGGCENFNNATGAIDGCGYTDNDNDDIGDMYPRSARGPCVDGRVKPDIIAPAMRIFGAASQDACFIGDHVCGSATNDGAAPPDDAYYPPDPDNTDTRDQDLYTWSTGTSHSCPAVAGGAALLRQWFLNHGHPAPSPAMTKAYLMNTTTHMTGTGANDDLPSDNQGMGRMNLGMAFDNAPRLLFDQIKTCHRNGTADASEIFTVEAQVADITRPFRVTLVWTDAPGTPGAGPMRKNDLDLELEIIGNGNFYRGNDFTLDASNPGVPADAPDDLNNVESVFLPANTLTPAMVRDFTVRVRPTDINSDGVTNNGDPDDQDFALVIYNAEFPPRNPVDIILVLDRSGSMNSIDAGGTQKKINLLKDAVEMFIRTWEPYSIPEDRMGIVYFNDSVSKFPNALVILHPFQDSANALIENVRAITATNCTALGAGILTAQRGFDATPGHQKHIIVFTNGMQNCSPMVTKLGGNHQILDDPNPPCCNSGVPDKPGINLAGYDVKAIHTIGTGVSGASWLNLIMNIAAETGGKTRFTSTPDEDLEDFFLEILVEALRVDPVEKVKTVSGIIARTESQKEELFSINSSVRKATFILSWRGGSPGDSLTFDLTAPNNITIPVQMQTIKTGSFYRIATIKLPLDIRRNRIEHAGTWKLVIKPALSADNVSYRAHLIVDDADVRYHFDVPAADYGVGDVIPLSFWAQHDNRTLSNLTGEVIAIITRPPVGFGTFMVKHPITQQQLDADIDLSDDMFSILAAKKAHILLQNSKLRKELEPTIDTITLYDDGNPEHGDVKENDGIYSALYKNTIRPGFYNIDLSLKAQDPQLGTIARSESKTITVGMKQFDMGKSSIDIRSVRPIDGKVAYMVNVLLIDSYGNYLGPGHNIDVVVAPPGKKWGPIGRRVHLDDNLDGSYSSRVELTEEEVDGGAVLELDVDGMRLMTVGPPPPRKWSVSIHSGTAIPMGSFADTFDLSYNLLADIDYHFSPRIALVGLLGYNDFKSKTAGIDNTYWINLSLNLRYYWPIQLKPGPRFSLYIGAGPGIYIPEDGDTEFGANAGCGLNYEFHPRIAFELGADYHWIFDPDVQFTHSHAGLVFRF